MKIQKISLKNKEQGKVDLPSQFEEEIRPDIVKRAVLAFQSKNRQPYGANPRAGKEAVAELSRRRRKYRGSYGYGISRVQRKILSRRGTRFNWVGAVSSGNVGGQRAHPPKAEKKWEQKINKKENRKAIRSAIAATANKEAVKDKGHKIPDNYPFVIEDKFQNIKKTKKVHSTLEELGFSKELERIAVKKVRAGRGKSRNRKYKNKKGILIIVSEDCPLLKSAKNIPGLDVVKVDDLNPELLAPGAKPGRATLWTESALKKLKEDKLYI